MSAAGWCAGRGAKNMVIENTMSARKRNDRIV
jgi:hypothetical protein